MTRAAAVPLERLHRFNHSFAPRLEHGQLDPDGIRGVRVTGYLSDESGWGAAGRGYASALRQLRVPMRIHDLSALTTNRSEDDNLVRRDTTADTDVNLVCVDAGRHFALLSKVGDSFFAGHYNIGAWAWELPHFPDSWYNRFAYYDEIWVTTSFIAAALTPISPVPVVRIPPVVSATRGSRLRGRRRLNVDYGTFVFAFMFDVHSHLTRKNPNAIIAAFRRAFPHRKDVRLVLKSLNGAADPDGYRELRDLAAGAPIDFYDEAWPAQEVHDLMAACDAYASLHRSEGTGLTIAEAMACGKPVITTDWSGNTDFADISNSFPVAYELATVASNAGPYRAGETWAEPDVEHAAWLMRQVVDDSSLAARRGQAARRRMRRDFSEEAVAALVHQRLDAIRCRNRLGVLRRTMSAFTEHRDVNDPNE
jgi:glycosyltransferase involved in cell wall biosynthesis